HRCSPVWRISSGPMGQQACARTEINRYIALVDADGGDGVGGYGFASADGVYAFIRFRFEADIFAGNLENLDQCGANRGKVRAEFWALANDHNVHVNYAHATARK